MTIQKRVKRPNPCLFTLFCCRKVKKPYTTDLANTRLHNYREPQKKKYFLRIFIQAACMFEIIYILLRL